MPWSATGETWPCCPQSVEVEMGNITVKVTTEPLLLNELFNFQPSLGHGAINTFIGIVRNLNLGRNVTKMEYDCYIPLCEKIFFDIATKQKQNGAPMRIF